MAETSAGLVEVVVRAPALATVASTCKLGSASRQNCGKDVNHDGNLEVNNLAVAGRGDDIAQRCRSLRAAAFSDVGCCLPRLRRPLRDETRGFDKTLRRLDQLFTCAFMNRSY